MSTYPNMQLLLINPARYAYGCNELVFNPLYKWWKGPFTKLFWRFLLSNIKMTSKITILAYIGTCKISLLLLRNCGGHLLNREFLDYAIACAVPLALANYAMVGWFNDSIDQFYLTSWKIFVGMAVIFNLLVGSHTTSSLSSSLLSSSVLAILAHFLTPNS